MSRAMNIPPLQHARNVVEAWKDANRRLHEQIEACQAILKATPEWHEWRQKRNRASYSALVRTSAGRDLRRAQARLTYVSRQLRDWTEHLQRLEAKEAQDAKAG